jgi:DNA-binding protein HU-beta
VTRSFDVTSADDAASRPFSHERDDPMTKAEFVQKVAKTADLSQAEAARAVQAVLNEISDALKDGEDVQFAGFGKFSVASRAARTGVNPRNPGTKIQIPARTVPKFSPGAVLKETVDAGGKRR